MGGAIETLVNEFAVKPWGAPSAAVTVAIVMPVANRAQARRKSRFSIVSAITLDSLVSLILSLVFGTRIVVPSGRQR